jgi:hypothetical protein
MFSDSKEDKWRMASSGMLRHVALVRMDVSEELNTSFIRLTRIGELGITLPHMKHIYGPPRPLTGITFFNY